MAFRPPPKRPQFADLISTLAQSKDTDSPSYQVIQEIINRLDQFAVGESVLGERGATGPPGPPAILDESFITVNPEPTLSNHRQLVAGTNVTLNTATPGQIIVHAAGGSGGGPHAPTHEPGGVDPMTVDAIPTVGSLRTLGTGPNQAAPGNHPGLGPHAPTHSLGGTDPVDVKNLAGYPGGTVNFLRADATFAPPPSGGGGGMNLDYLGDYVTPQTYFDGDIVIGPDGIAYMCVVDGTTTPPEPWPGVGIAINPAVDATYWTVSNHPQLTNERVMSSLANGYVKSTAGEPSTVPSIPPGDLPPFIAYTNIQNQFTRDQRINNAGGDLPRVTLTDVTQPLNQKTWQILNIGTALNFWALDDVEGSILAAVSIDRTGKITGDGGGLTNLNASNLATGLAAPLRLGNGSPDATTFLRGDSTWQPISTIGFPSGLIVISVTPCPAGWTRIASWDGLFLRSGPTIGVTGGANTHAHGPGSYAAASHGHGSVLSLAGGTDLQGTHAHGHTLSGFGSTGDSIGNTSGADAGGSFTASYAAHHHDVAVTISGGINNDGLHSHNLSGSVTLVAEAPGVTGTSDAASSLPPFVDIYYCQKN